ncbi:MAG: alanine racemase [Anaerolineae bacterium]
MSSEASGPLAWLEIDLKNIAWNLTQIRALVGQAMIMAVIKNNAYGHGMVEVARFLASQGVEFFGVVGVMEGRQLRAKGIGAEILNLGFFSRGEVADIVEAGITQALFREEDARCLAEEAGRQRKPVKVHIKVDTGLGRLGVPHDQAVSFVEMVHGLEGLEIEGIFSVLTEEPEFDRIQLSRFLTVTDTLEKRGITTIRLKHLASSAAILDLAEAHLDLVRPGIMLYGWYPSLSARQEGKIALRPAMSLKARVGYIKTIPAGEGVSYHRRFRVERETGIATLPIGYCEGYPKGMSQGGQVLIGGKRYPIVGDVCANLSMVALGQDRAVTVGDEAVLMGKQGEDEITADDIGQIVAQSCYHVVSGMSARLPRLYLK